MAGLNEDFLKALRDTPLKNEQNEYNEPFMEALQALLAARDLQDKEKIQAAFREAIFEHQAFWQPYFSNELTEDFIKGNEFLDLTQEDSFPILYQEAAEKRALMGLYSVSDAVLVQIAEAEKENCREQLGLDPDCGELAKGDFAWLAEEDEVALFTDGAVERVQAAAKELLALKREEHHSFLKDLHHSELAALLENLPDIQLNDDRIIALNQFLDAGNNVNINNGTFNDPVKYKNFLDQVQKLVAPEVSSEVFYKHFGLRADGADFEKTAIATAIKQQCIYNENLYNTLARTPLESVKALLTSFLGLKKTEPMHFDTESLRTLPTFDDLTERFPFAQEINPELFYTAKNYYLSTASAIEVIPIVHEMAHKLETLKKERPPFKKLKDNLKFIQNLNPLHLMKPERGSRGKNQLLQMKEDFDELAEDCDQYLKYLKEEGARLEGMLDSLPSSLLVDPRDPRAGELVRDLRAKLADELKEVRAYEAEYSALQEKIKREDQTRQNPGIAQALGLALQGVEYVIHSDSENSVEQHIYNRAEFDAMLKDPSLNYRAEQANGAVISYAQDERDFSVEDALSPGQIRILDVRHNSADAQGEKFFARLSEERGRPESHLNQKTGEVTQTVSSRFQVLKFPQGEGSEAAKAYCAMVIARQVLANLNKAPDSKKPIQLTGENKEELAYIWTALIILGKTDPKLKFGADAIKVYSAAFQPSQERNIFGFSGDSLYKTAFKDATISNLKEAQESMSEERLGHEKDKSKAINTLHKFKNVLKDAREEPEVAAPPVRPVGPVGGST